jgi:hypothetical protein
MSTSKRIMIAATLVTVVTGLVADDGLMFRKNISGTPDYDTEFASIRMLPLYVPPQSSAELVLEGIDYTNADGDVVETLSYAQPLIVHYTGGPVTFIE